MNNTEILLIEILSAFVNGREPVISTEYDATELYDLAKAHSVHGIVGYMFSKYGVKAYLVDKRFADIYDKIITQLIRKEFYAQNVLESLNKAEIPHILFKGLVVKNCYPVPELRTFGDIDIIIPENCREKAHKLMCGAGYCGKLMDGGDVYSYKKGAENYEFHTSLNAEKTRLSESMSNFWQYAVCKNGFTYEFEDEFHLSYLISHIEKHFYGSGAGVRMYLDIALFLKSHRETLNLAKVREILRECELEKFFDSALLICNKWFETDITPAQDFSSDFYSELCRYILRGGVFGLQNKELINENQVRQAISQKGKAGKVTLLLSHIFPPYIEVKRLYPFFNGKPYLLPLSWVVHFIKASKRSGLKNIKQIIKADSQKAKSKKEFFDSAGSKR